MGVSVGGVLRQWSAYFRRGRMVRGNVWLAAKCTAKRREAQLFTYPRLREAGWLAAVVSLAHIGVVGTGDL